MRRVLHVINLDFIFRIIVIISLILYGIPWFLKIASGRYQFGPWDFSFLQPQPEMLSVYLVVWLFIALVVNWGRQLDVLLTFAFRTRAFCTGVLSYMMFAVVWTLPILVIGTSLHDVIFQIKQTQPAFEGLTIALAASVLPTTYLLAAYAWRGILDIRFDHCCVEGSLRMLFSTVAGAGLGTIALLGL